MVILLDPSQTADVILPCDRALPPHEQTVFRIRAISARIASTLRSDASETDPLRPMMTILRASLVSWSGARMADGAVIGCPASEAEWERVPDLFTMKDLSFLCETALDMSRLGEEERKNSDSAQPS